MSYLLYKHMYSYIMIHTFMEFSDQYFYSISRSLKCIQTYKRPTHLSRGCFVQINYLKDKIRNFKVGLNVQVTLNYQTGFLL